MADAEDDELIFERTKFSNFKLNFPDNRFIDLN